MLPIRPEGRPFSNQEVVHGAPERFGLVERWDVLTILECRCYATCRAHRCSLDLNVNSIRAKGVREAAKHRDDIRHASRRTENEGIRVETRI